MAANYILHAHLSDQPPRQVPFPRWGQGIVGLQLTSRISLQVGAEIVSEAGLHPFTVRIADVEYTAVGIGGIRTGGPWRRQGYGALITQTAMAVARQHYRPALLALFTLDNTLRWYQRLGFTKVLGSVRIAQPNGQTIGLPPAVSLMLDGGTVSHVQVESLPW